MNEHPQHDAEFELYALGALDDAERAAVAEHLSACPGCRGRLRAAEGRVALLGLAAPPASPSPDARRRVLERVSGRIAGPGEAPWGESSARRPGLFGWPQPAWGLAAAALAALALILFVADRRAERELTQLQRGLQRQQAEAAHAQAMIALLTARDTLHIELVAEGPQHTCMVFFNARQRAVCFTGSLPQLPPDRTYQIWLVPSSGAPISAGTFRPDARGAVAVDMWALPSGMAPKAFAVTIEPAPGMPQPTGPKVMVGAVT